MRLLNLAPFRYLLVGGVNTIAGLLIIYACKWFMGLGDIKANLIGYLCGFVLSFVLNKQWTFRFTGDALPADATFERLDITDPAAANATGQTLTFTISSANTAIQDATYNYSQKTAAIDLKGASYVMILVATAGATLTNGGTPTAEVMFLN